MSKTLNISQIMIEADEPKLSLFSDIFYENIIFNMVNKLDNDEKKALFTILKDYLKAEGRYRDLRRY